jgi:cold shock CspA family protein
MRGIIKLFSKGLGKIIVGNKESAVLTFPETFENKDEVEVSFRDKNMTQISHIVAYSKDIFYGKIIQKFNHNSGIALITYPKLIGTILVNGAYNVGDRLEFKIEKLFNGKINAINIKKVSKDNFFKTESPIFGKIEKEVIYSKEGVITDIIDKVKNVVKGKIKVVKMDRGFGFIAGADGNDYFFMLNFYRQFYNSESLKGQEVIFEAQSNNRGMSVRKFVKTDTLPENKQFIEINNKIKIPIKEYKNYFNSTPEVGDIISYIEDNNFKFVNNDTVINKTIFKIYNNSKNIQNGVITYFNNQKKFGFIENKNKERFFFLENIFKDFYKRTPKKGDKVSFISKKSEKGLAIRNFLIASFEVDKSKFKNFVEIDAEKSYYAFIDGSEIKEIYVYESTDLFQSISCFKDNKNIKSKIEAIDCMLKNDYSSKNITKEKLLKDKLKYLENLIKENLDKNNLIESIKYEAQYQKISYNPQRLSKISQFLSKKDEIITNEIKIKKIKSKNTPLNILEIGEVNILKKNSSKIDFIEDVKITKIKQKEESLYIILKEQM